MLYLISHGHLHQKNEVFESEKALGCLFNFRDYLLIVNWRQAKAVLIKYKIEIGKERIYRILPLFGSFYHSWSYLFTKINII